ncbi:MAG: hypothetical protein R2818_01515 [Flavobacteriales bacterium]
MKTPIQLTMALSILFGSMSLFVGAQEHDPPELSPERLKEIQAQRSAFITSALSLTPEESQRFWPLYNEMSDKREALRKEHRQLHHGMRKGQERPSEAEATAILNKSLIIKQRELDLERDYTERFKKAIGAVKTVGLERAERDFHREVLRKYRDRVEGKDGPPPPR